MSSSTEKSLQQKLSDLSLQATSSPSDEQMQSQAKISANLTDSTSVESQVAEDSEHTCVKCNKPAVLRCQACSYSEEKGVDQPTWYCGKGCQQADWPSHKSSCRKVACVNQIYRAARVVQALFYAFRENTFDLSIGRIEVGERGIRMWEKPYDEAVMVPFPSHLISDPSVHEAVLSYLACSEAILWMEDMFSKLLEGIAMFLWPLTQLIT